MPLGKTMLSPRQRLAAALTIKVELFATKLQRMKARRLGRVVGFMLVEVSRIRNSAMIIRIVLGGLTLSAVATSARAEIHEYMILRLIYLGTSCGTEHLSRIEVENKNWRRFKVQCRDVSSYPNGIIVTCTDIHDDRSCKVDTPAANFDSLELLRPKMD